MNLRQETINLIKRYNITPNLLKDQHFIIDKRVLKRMVELAEIRADEIVLEIGCGLGTLTKELAKRAKQVHGIEIDRQFSAILNQLNQDYSNLYITSGNALNVLPWKDRPWSFHKVVSNLPYRLCEPLFHKFIEGNFRLMVFMVPKTFGEQALNHPIFTAYYNIKKEFEVAKETFYPVPKTKSTVLILTYKPDPLGVRDMERFVRQYIYRREDTLLRNSLMRAAMLVFERFYKKRLTKNQARAMVREIGISESELEKKVRYIALETYFKSAKGLQRLLRKK